jgi:hypothetical protein
MIETTVTRTLYCDYKDCGKTLSISCSTDEYLIDIAAHNGWVRIGSLLPIDSCPDHRKSSIDSMARIFATDDA